MEELENQNAGQQVDTATTDADTTAENENIGQNDTETSKEVKSFTEEQVNNIVRERLERAKQSLYKTYGVDNRDGLDQLFKKSASYDEMETRYNDIIEKNNALNQELMFLRYNINDSRREDVKALFKGKGLEFTEENLTKELVSHPEWLNVAKEEPKTTIKSLGINHGDHKTLETEEEKQKRIFGI